MTILQMQDQGGILMKRVQIFVIALLAIFVLSACGPSAEEQEQAAGTQVAETAQALLTELALASPTETKTPIPTAPEFGTPTETPTPSSTPVATATSVSTTVSNLPVCDRAGFVSDVTVPDGTEFSPGSGFTKTWRLRNDGTCTWTELYTVVFFGGSDMGGPASSAFPAGNVAPGETIDLSLQLTAPADNGNYTGNWLLKNTDGTVFGLDAGNFSFYVEINVTDGAATAAPSDTPDGATTTTPTPTPSPTPTDTPGSSPTETHTPTPTDTPTT
jgi:hypothetical protein